MTLMEVGQLLGNVGAFVGAIAVIATLVYISVQVRQAKELGIENARAARFQNDLSFLTSLINAEMYNQSWEKAVAVDGTMYEYTERLMADYGFSVPEAHNMTWFCFAWMKFEEHAFLSAITTEDQQMHDSQVAGFLSYPLFRKFWCDSSKQMLDRRFVAHVDEALQGLG